MKLPVMPPVAPMLAKSAREIPVGGYMYEPKWDGFRCIVYRDQDEVELGSRNGKPLTRYFPELVAAARAHLPERCVVDGEVVVAGPDGLDFDVLSERIHPAASRVELLSRETPASFVAFDLLAIGEVNLLPTAFSARRKGLETALAGADSPIYMTPITSDAATANDWFQRFEGAGLDGVVAKPVDVPYLPDQRAMVKVKHERTGDFVVGGFRWYQTDRSVVGSLMLGLYEGQDLHHVGVIGSFPAAMRRQLVGDLEPYRHPDEHPWAQWSDFMVADGGRQPGTMSRWNAGKDLSFELISPTLVVEAAFEHLQGRRLRHTARFRRWRPDRDAMSCTYDQLDVAVPALLSDVFGAGG
ncbi:MAG TPA: ATP-dependent DNA ligase [Acidimicrobiales bacterium]|nr:ATP-dependent DNA ligase [Acidimicrobiales bacterium]